MVRKDKEMKISIIIPVYNVEEYILDCLNSVVSQTYRGEIECILVDDCSTDNSRGKINNFIKSYQGLIDFRLICQPQNMRQGMARNRGLNEATGDYILFVDSDDVISDNCLETMCTLLRKYPNTDFVLCGMENMNAEKVFAPDNYPEYTEDRKFLMYKFLYVDDGIPVGPCNKLIRKKILEENNIYFPGKVIFEDIQFSIILGLYVVHACFCPSITYYYRTNREGSTITTTSKSLEFGFASRIVVLNNCVKRMTDTLRLLQVKALLSRYCLYLNMYNLMAINANQQLVDEFKMNFLNATTGFHKLLILSVVKIPIAICKNKYVYSLLKRMLK